MKHPFFFVLFCLSFSIAIGQEKITLKNPVKDNIINTYTGMLLVRTGKTLHGISPQSKTVQWQNDNLGKVNFSSYKEIPYSPLVVFEDKPIINSKLLSNTVNAKGTSRTILNVVDGKVLFDSEEIGFKSVNQTLFIPDHKAILVDGILEKEMAIALYGYQDHRMVWKTNLTDSNFFKDLKGTLFNKEKVLLDKDQNVFWLKNNCLLKINGRTGEIMFQKNEVESISMNRTKNMVYVFSKAGEIEKLKRATDIMAYAAKDMTHLWSEPTRIQGTIKEIAFDSQKMITITSTGFNIIDTEGKKQWPQMTSLPLIKKIVPVPRGFLVVQEKFLSLIGDDGKKVWAKPLKISLSNDEAPVHLFESDKSAIYVTPSRANKITISNGQKLWDDVILNDADFISRNLKLSIPTYRIWFDSIAKQYPVYSQNKLYLINTTSKNTPKSQYAFDFGRSLPKMKIFEYGYFMENDNTFFLFERSGALVYEKKFLSNKSSSLLGETFYYVKRGFGTYRAATGFIHNQVAENISSTIAKGNLGLLTNFGSTVYGSYKIYQDPKKIISNLEELGLSSGLEAVFKRIKKGKEGEDTTIIVAPQEDETASIIRLHIPTGKEDLLKQIASKASFVIDQVENLIYSFNGKEIQIERL